MEYLDRLGNAIQSLENSSDKLSKIPELLVATEGLIEEVVEEKDVVEKSYKELDKLRIGMEEQNEELSKLTEENKRSLDHTIAVVKEELLKNKKENIEAIDSVTTIVSNKLSVSESNLQSVLGEKIKSSENNLQVTLSDKITAAEKNLNTTLSDKVTTTEEELKEVVQKNTDSVIECIHSLSAKVEEYNKTAVEVRELVKQTRILVIVSIVLSVIAIIIKFV